MRTDDYSLIWKALAAEIRREILDLLRERPHTTGELAQTFAVSRFAVMKHLSVLEQSGLITVRKQGRERWNTLNPLPLQLIYERWMRPYESEWSQALLQLKRVAEGNAGYATEPRSTEGEQGAGLQSLTITLDIPLQSSPRHVYDALLHHVSAWWGYPYVHRDSTGLIIEPFVGGRLYEQWNKPEGGALLATVSYLKANEEVRLVGPIGLPEPSKCVVVFRLEPVEYGQTLLHFSLEAFGRVDARSQTMYEAGWKDLLDIRLRAFVEREIGYGLDYQLQGWFDDERSSSYPS